MSADLLETVGLIAKRNEGQRLLRSLPRSGDVSDPRPARADGRLRRPDSAVISPIGRSRRRSTITRPKRRCSRKSDQLYGIDQARKPAAKAGYLAVVEGYTDVLMAHQHGVSQVVATMGTALNARHVKKLRSVVPRVVLVFDADAGGDTGVDRALEVFVSQDLDLRMATLPEGLDPCDLLVQQGPEPFRKALDKRRGRVRVQAAAGLGREASQRTSKDSGGPSEQMLGDPGR